MQKSSRFKEEFCHCYHVSVLEVKIVSKNIKLCFIIFNHHITPFVMQSPDYIRKNFVIVMMCRFLNAR